MQLQIDSKFKVNNLPIGGELQIQPGKMTLLQGSNGIGKSSFIQILKKDQLDYFKEQKVVFIDQTPLVPLNEISLAEVITQWKKKRNEELDLFDMAYEKCKGFKDMALKNLSGGQNQLAKIALGTYFSGDIFILDEPFQHLDQVNIRFLQDLISQLLERGKSVFIIEHRADLVRDLVHFKFEMIQLAHEIRIQSGS